MLWTIVFAVTDATTVLADLVFVIAKSAVERSKFAELIALVVVLTFRRGGSLGITFSTRIRH